ncbi:rhodanese-like domain-containing protein [Verrucomicrobiales bacterium BCK34]|nr:rhodanese-like domain-containing protein [Verrucomicrobiales bacterium BCK34]
MKYIPLLFSLYLTGSPLFTAIGAESPAESTASISNSQIDYEGFLKLSQEVAPYRETRRISVEAFVKFSGEPGTIILDTRSRRNFERKHIKGAVHLNFSDLTKEELERVVPSKDTRILIYCNNNFRNNTPAFALKSAPAALNIPTFITLYEYGYRNLYELGPIIEESDPEIELYVAPQ